MYIYILYTHTHAHSDCSESHILASWTQANQEHAGVQQVKVEKQKSQTDPSTSYKTEEGEDELLIN